MVVTEDELFQLSNDEYAYKLFILIHLPSSAFGNTIKRGEVDESRRYIVVDVDGVSVIRLLGILISGQNFIPSGIVIVSLVPLDFVSVTELPD